MSSVFHFQLVFCLSFFPHAPWCPDPCLPIGFNLGFTDVVLTVTYCLLLNLQMSLDVHTHTYYTHTTTTTTTCACTYKVFTVRHNKNRDSNHFESLLLAERAFCFQVNYYHSSGSPNTVGQNFQQLQIPGAWHRTKRTNHYLTEPNTKAAQ